MSIDLDDGTIHEKCLTCEKWVCECEPEIRRGGGSAYRAPDGEQARPACRESGVGHEWFNKDNNPARLVESLTCNDRAPGDVASGELGESGTTRVVPDSLPLIAGGRATVLSAYTVVVAIGLVGLAILWEVVR